LTQGDPGNSSFLIPPPDNDASESAEDDCLILQSFPMGELTVTDRFNKSAWFPGKGFEQAGKIQCPAPPAERPVV